MFRVKIHRETNSSFIFIKLQTIWAKIAFSQQGLFQYFSFYRIQNQICSNIMVQIKGQRATSLTFSFLKLLSIESHFRDKDYSNTFILPNTKPNMFKYYGTNHGTKSDKFKLLISQTWKRRGQNHNFASRVILFYRT